MSERPPRKGRFQRLDRAAGKLWRGVTGSVLLLVGVVALAEMVSADDFSLRAYWPGLLIDALFFLAAAALFRSNRSLSEGLE